jgi:hypothetical protein
MAERVEGDDLALGADRLRKRHLGRDRYRRLHAALTLVSAADVSRTRISDFARAMPGVGDVSSP